MDSPEGLKRLESVKDELFWIGKSRVEVKVDELAKAIELLKEMASSLTTLATTDFKVYYTTVLKPKESHQKALDVLKKYQEWK